MVFFRHNTGKVINPPDALEENLDLSSYGFKKRPIPIALPDYGQRFFVTYHWPADDDDRHLQLCSVALAQCVVSYGVLLVEPM